MNRKAAAATTTMAINGGLKSIGCLDGGDWWISRAEEEGVGGIVGPNIGECSCSGGLAAIFRKRK